MTKAWLMVLNDEDFTLFSTKAKAKKALAQAYRHAINKENVTKEARATARKYWKTDKEYFSVDVDGDVTNMYQLSGYIVEKEIH